MKDSGIEWIGEIPEEWSIKNIGQLYTERKQKVSDKEYAPLSVTMKGILPQLSTAAKTDAHDDRKLVKVGDFAINSRSDRRGSCGISAYDGSVSLINTILKPRKEMNPVYYNWLFHTSLFSDEYYKWGHGIVDDLWTTNWQDMKRIGVPVPNLSEQTAIAAYLDRQCTHIDNIIEKTKTSIEEYKKLKQAVITQAVTKGIRGNREMKDSGIEWIGEIPKSYTVMRIKNLGVFRNGLTYSPESQCSKEEGTLVLRSSNIQNGKLELIDNVYVKTLIPDNLFVSKGDIIICSRNGSRNLIGKCAIIEKDIIASFGAFMMIFRCKSPLYIYYVLNSDVFKYYLSSFLTSTINQLTGSVFGNMKIVYCNDICEQQEIAAYLDQKCTEIDAIITKKQQFITEMENYKKSLIFECVTGKREVSV